MTYSPCAYKGQEGVGDGGDYFVLYVVGKYSRLVVPGVEDSGLNGPDNMINCVFVLCCYKM